MPLATLVDTEALLNVAIFGFAGAVGLVGVFGVGLLAWDRVAGRTDEAGGLRVAWSVVLALAALGCAAIVVLGIWAMMQK
jgi:NADH:ubiquinone oxidoreductase subunit 6 (subunit J)